MSDDDSLVKTRARRANAGSRLKQLISLEEKERENQILPSHIVSEEDLDVNLLFQEDENDEEFMEEEEDSDEVQESDGGEEDGEQTAVNEDGEKGEDVEEGESGSEGISMKVDSDEQLSDSEISLSDTDESEGEKELEREEKLKNRSKKRSRLVVPEIKKFDNNPQQKKRKKKVSSSELLMKTDRRSSSRAAVVQSKNALVKRLKENEKKRAKSAPIVRPKYVELTQEERLIQAVETEKENILALNQFREQEIVKKERQKQLLQSRREKLKNVIRLVSRETFISPLDEVKEARRRQELALKAKKKPGRKRKNPLPVEKVRLPGEVDMDLPIAKAELGHLVKEPEESPNSTPEINNDKPEQVEDITTDPPENPNTDIGESDNKETIASGPADANEPNDTGKAEDDNTEKMEIVEVGLGADRTNLNEKDVKPEGPEETTITENSIVSNVEPLKPNTPDTEADKPSEGESSSRNEESVEASLAVKIENEENSNSVQDEEVPESKGEDVKEEKKVKFADQSDEELQDEVDNTESKQSSPSLSKYGEKEIFEGPCQRIARNLLYLIDFEQDKQPIKLDSSDVKTALFGKDSLLPASRRFKDLTTILRIRKVENPYAVSKDEKDTLYVSVSKLDEEDPMFEDLRKLPKLGEQEEIVEEIEENEKEDNPTIVINTEAPAGLYLPNGNKKICLISGTEVKYFDPSNGIPYSSVETYRLLKTIEQSNVPWYSISSELNDGVATELYLGSRQGVRHAKGVPEGFDT